MPRLIHVFYNLLQRDPRAVKGDILHDKHDLLSGESDWALRAAEFCRWNYEADAQLL